MVEQPPTPRHSPHGTPLGSSVGGTESAVSYSAETPRACRLWWRVRGVLRWPVRQGH